MNTSNQQKTDSKLHIVIFSKDRALQLHSLLRSIKDHWLAPYEEVTVLYATSTEQFNNGYRKLISQCPIERCNWTKETSFAIDVKEIIGSFDSNDLVMFLVDDVIFFRPFANEKLIQSFTRQHLFISLRCSRSYPEQQPKTFLCLDNMLEWRWNFLTQETVTWNYPFSLDGNIFHCGVVRKAINNIVFRAPNSLEGQLHRYRRKWWVRRKQRALGETKPVLFNNPLNRVQVEWSTAHADIPVEDLNVKYLANYQIDNKSLYGLNPNSCHYEAPINFIKLTSDLTIENM